MIGLDVPATASTIPSESSQAHEGTSLQSGSRTGKRQAGIATAVEFHGYRSGLASSCFRKRTFSQHMLCEVPTVLKGHVLDAGRELQQAIISFMVKLRLKQLTSLIRKAVVEA